MQIRATYLRTLQRDSCRSGVTLVENALVISLLGIFFTGIMEFGHGYMVQASLNAAAQRTARYGSVDGVTTIQALNYANAILAKSIKTSSVLVQIKDGSAFDNVNFNPGNVNYGLLPDAELNSMEDNQIFIVRITVPYRAVALLPPFWTESVTIQAISVMRHE